MNKVLSESWFNFKENEEKVQAIIIGVIALLVPLFLGKLIDLIFGSSSGLANNSQLIIGTIVNSLLIVSAINLTGWKRLVGVVTMPSVAAILGGYVFKTSSVYMIWMIPAIWLGNFALIYVYKVLKIRNGLNFFLTGIIGVIVKVLIIFAFFSLLNGLNVFPNAVVDTIRNAMSILQLLTGCFGMILAYLVYSSYR